ncbi:MAG: ABC transporter ATP-binding protein, partial [Candidatus Uhrbacteria bacterium]|nr:ABC transporter ATP-binding protein [Candidatus Uhrbacteria bacterium]
MDAESENWKDYHKGVGEILHVYRWIWKELLNKESRRLLRPIMLFTVFGNALAMLVPWVFGQLIDQVRTHKLQTTVLLLGGFAAAKFLHKRCGYYVGCAREMFFGASRGSVDEATNRLFFEKSLGQMLQDHDQLSAANLNKGRNQLYQIMDLLLFEGVETALMLLMAFVCLWILHPLSGAIVTTVFFIFFLWSRFLHRKIAEVCVPIDVAFRWLERHRTETWDKVEKIKTGGKEKEEVSFMAHRFREILTKDRSFWLWFIKQLTRRSMLNDLALLAIVMIGSWHMWRGEWSLGLFYPVYTWSCLMVDSFERMSRIEQRISWSFPSVSSLKETLTMKPDIRDTANAIEPDVAEGVHVEVLHVSHAYRLRTNDQARHAVLSDVSFTIEPGEVVALLGPSGAGKSTLMRLIQRGMDPDQGAVLVNGHDLRNLRLRSWLMNTGYIPQQPIILTGTIRSNLLYGLDPDARTRVSDEELLKLMRELRIDFGGRLTHG